MVGRCADAAVAQPLGQPLGALLRRHVDDARRPGLHDRLDDRARLGLRVVEAPHRQVDVRPVEATDDDLGVVHPQPAEDLVAHGRRRRRGQRQDRGAPERRDRVGKPEVVGPEVVAPLRDAVRLVDDEQRRPRRDELGQRVLVGQLLGGQQHELDLALLHALDGLGPVALAHGRVQRRRLALVDGLHLVALQRDQRRDDDRRPVDQQAGQLVDRRLARAGRHDRQRVAAVEHRPHRLELPRAQRVEAQPLPGDSTDLGLAGHLGEAIPARAARRNRRPTLKGWPPRDAGPSWRSSASRCPAVPASTCSATPAARSSMSARPRTCAAAWAVTSPTRSPAAPTRWSTRSSRWSSCSSRRRPRRCSPNRASSSSTGRASTSGCATTSPIRSSPSRWTRSSRASTSRASAIAATACTSAPTRAPSARARRSTAGQGLPVPLLPGHGARAADRLALPGLLHQALRRPVRRLRHAGAST